MGGGGGGGGSAVGDTHFSTLEKTHGTL